MAEDNLDAAVDSAVLSMSDEAMANLDAGAVDALVAKAESDYLAAQKSDGGDASTDADPDLDDNDDDDDEGVVDGATDTDTDDDPDSVDDSGNVDDDSDDATGQDGVDDDAEGDDKADDENSSPEAQAMLDELFAPFKAIGKEVQVDNIADARQLMQMGIGYNKRMQAMKPHMQVLKMLQKNDILDPAKLNFLIDLQNKDPAAIAKLVADSGIDPLDIPTKDLGDYKPNTYNVSEEEVALDDVIDEIRESEHYETTSEIVTNKWDKASQDILVNNPGIIRDLNEQVGNGVYEQITKVVESERMFNRLGGMSDIEAYQHVGQALAKAGTLVGVESQPKPKSETKAATGDPSKTDTKLKDRKRAAGSTKAKPATVDSGVNLDPLAMSDTDFEDAMAKGLFNLK